jgi:hypothetical protein
LVASGSKVLKDSLEGVLVVRARVSSVVAKGYDGIAKVRIGPQHGVHKGTEGTLIEFGIYLRGCELDQAFIEKG